MTIPQSIRERFGLLPETEVEFVVRGNAVQIVKAKSGRDRGEAVVSRLRGRAKSRMTTDEIMKLTRS